MMEGGGRGMAHAAPSVSSPVRWLSFPPSGGQNCARCARARALPWLRPVRTAFAGMRLSGWSRRPGYQLDSGSAPIYPDSLVCRGLLASKCCAPGPLRWQAEGCPGRATARFPAQKRAHRDVRRPLSSHADSRSRAGARLLVPFRVHASAPQVVGLSQAGPASRG
jgi:hypothetical protein